jgi:DUF1680 family protein
MPLSVDPFPLSRVRLHDGPFKHAQDLDHAYLLRLEPDRLLHRFREFAGLQPKGEEYGGWEKDTISGHSLGHYLSAISLMYGATGDPELKKRAAYIVDELAECQKAEGNGYVGGLPDHKRLWAEIERGEIRSKGFDLNGLWVPWYNLHKTFAGLLDAHEQTGNAKALQVAKDLADWSIHITRNLSDAQWQQMLACEHGGMNEVLAELYARTGEKKYLDLSRSFHQNAFMKPLEQGIDNLPGRHANTNIPKIIGAIRDYELTSNSPSGAAATFFWETVVHDHSYAIGGNSQGEYFAQPRKLADRLAGNTTETCNTYNMLKLTQHLFTLGPSAELGDYYERAMLNHILASQNPDNGMMTYFVPLNPGGKKDYSDEENSFWCCVGTGMENHAKYGESVYFRDGETLLVDQFISSELDWKEKGVRITQTTNFPLSDTVSLDIHGDASFGLRFRRPGWVAAEPVLKINGEKVSYQSESEGFIEVSRVWKDGDKVELTLPMNLRLESMPDRANRVAIFYGPMVLAADMDELPEAWRDRMPVLLASGRDPSKWLRPIAGKPGFFRTTGVGRPAELKLQPFHLSQHNRYSAYFDLYTEAEWAKTEADYRAAEDAKRALEARTVDFFQPGQMQPERDHKVEGETTYAGDYGGSFFRDARNGGWFTFEMKVDPDAAQDLICTYWGGDRGRVFKILVDGVELTTQRLDEKAPGRFYDETYPLGDMTKGKSKVLIKFQAPVNGMAGGVFGVRVARRAS